MRYRTVVWLLAALAAGACAGEQATADVVELFPIVQDGKWGYINKAGTIVIEPQHECAWDFTEGLARVQVNKRRGFIDKTGKMVVEPKYGMAWAFSEGLAAVFVGGQVWGDFMNLRGSGAWGYIDRTGKLVIRADFAKAGDFHEGFAATYKGDKWGFTDKDGKWAPLHGPGCRPGDFSQGLAAVSDGGKTPKWGYVNSEVKMVIETRFAGAGPFSEGLAAIAVAEETVTKDDKGTEKKTTVAKWGFMDKTGNIVIQPQFGNAGVFSDGLAGVQIKDNKWGCINKEGKVAIEPQFDFVAPFSEGKARVVSGGKHGFIDKTGRLVIEPKFQLAWDFSNGLARVETEGKQAYLDKSGNCIWPPKR